MAETYPPEQRSAEARHSLKRYWQKNLLLTIVLLFVWAAVSLGCGILLADVLNEYRLFGTGYPLGFWFAQQGSIIVFVFLILIYAICMNRLDKKHHAELDAIFRKGGE